MDDNPYVSPEVVDQTPSAEIGAPRNPTIEIGAPAIWGLRIYEVGVVAFLIYWTLPPRFLFWMEDNFGQYLLSVVWYSTRGIELLLAIGAGLCIPLSRRCGGAALVMAALVSQAIGFGIFYFHLEPFEATLYLGIVWRVVMIGCFAMWLRALAKAMRCLRLARFAMIFSGGLVTIVAVLIVSATLPLAKSGLGERGPLIAIGEDHWSLLSLVVIVSLIALIYAVLIHLVRREIEAAYRQAN